MRQLNKKIALILFLTGIIMGCQNDTDINQDISDIIPKSDVITVESAKDWIEGNIKNARIGKNKINSESISWNYVVLDKMKGDKKTPVVVVPILGNNEGKIPKMKQIWIYDNNKGVRTGRIFEYIFDFKSNKFNSLKNFSGALIIRDMDGLFLGGMKINKNKIEGVLSEITLESGQIESMKKLDNARTSNFVCGHGVSCVNWSISAGTGPKFYGFNCDTDFNCWWVSSNQMDPAFTGYIIDIPAPSYEPGGGSGDPVEQAPTATNYGYANDKCRGLLTMLATQKKDSVEVGGVITKMGQVFMFPTGNNTKTSYNMTDVYQEPGTGRVMLRVFRGNPDAGDPMNDNKYNENSVYLEMYNYQTLKNMTWEIEGFIHTHPLGVDGDGTEFDSHNPSPQDRLVAESWGPNVNNYIVTDRRLLKYGATGSPTKVDNPCKK